MNFEFKPRTQPIYSDDLFYDLFLCGYLKPEKLLVKSEQIEEVNKAMQVIDAYIGQAIGKGLIEEA